MATTFAQALYQRAYLTSIDYGIAFGMSVMAGAILIDIGKAIITYGAAIVLAMIILMAMVTVPIAFGVLPSPGDVLLTSLWITIVFSAVFPFPFLLLLVGTIIGSFIGEKYF